MQRERKKQQHVGSLCLSCFASLSAWPLFDPSFYEYKNTAKHLNKPPWCFTDTTHTCRKCFICMTKWQTASSGQSWYPPHSKKSRTTHCKCIEQGEKWSNIWQKYLQQDVSRLNALFSLSGVCSCVTDLHAPPPVDRRSRPAGSWALPGWRRHYSTLICFWSTSTGRAGLRRRETQRDIRHQIQFDLRRLYL